MLAFWGLSKSRPIRSVDRVDVRHDCAPIPAAEVISAPAPQSSAPADGGCAAGKDAVNVEVESTNVEMQQLRLLCAAQQLRDIVELGITMTKVARSHSTPCLGCAYQLSSSRWPLSSQRSLLVVGTHSIGVWWREGRCAPAKPQHPSLLPPHPTPLPVPLQQPLIPAHTLPRQCRQCRRTRAPTQCWKIPQCSQLQDIARIGSNCGVAQCMS